MITAERLRELVAYDPETGVFIRHTPARAWQSPAKNVSGFKGVRWHKAGKAWQGRIKIDGKERHLGLFDTPEEAAVAYQEVERKAFVAHQAGWVRLHRDMGYQHISIDGNEYRAHHLAFLYMTGRWPKTEVDHINHNPLDNRWSNLREAARPENCWNQRIRSDNTSGFKGVQRHGQRWRAIIQTAGVRHYLGTFDDPQTAAIFYATWAQHHFREYAHPNIYDMMRGIRNKILLTNLANCVGYEVAA